MKIEKKRCPSCGCNCTPFRHKKRLEYFRNYYLKNRDRILAKYRASKLLKHTTGTGL